MIAAGRGRVFNKSRFGAEDGYYCPRQFGKSAGLIIAPQSRQGNAVKQNSVGNFGGGGGVEARGYMVNRMSEFLNRSIINEITDLKKNQEMRLVFLYFSDYPSIN